MSTLRDHLQSIYDQKGKLTPALVLDEARDPNHPLHHRFQWDDSKAAEAYRLQQARDLIRSVRVTYREATEKEQSRAVRGFVAPRSPDKPNEYIPVEEALADPLTRKLLLKQMERQWQDMKRQYGHMVEFWQLLKPDVDDKTA